MKSSVATVIGALSTAAASVVTPIVLECTSSATYVDGGLYAKKQSGGNINGLLNGAMSGTDVFSLNWATNSDVTSFLLTERIGDSGITFERFNLIPYIDVSEGAFAPIRFTSDNSTLTGGETSFGFLSAYGFLMWSPTGKLADVLPASGNLEVWQGWQLVESDVTDVYQIYWNQTKFENDDRGDLSYQMGQCYGVYNSTVDMINFVDDL